MFSKDQTEIENSNWLNEFEWIECLSNIWKQQPLSVGAGDAPGDAAGDFGEEEEDDTSGVPARSCVRSVSFWELRCNLLVDLELLWGLPWQNDSYI